MMMRNHCLWLSRRAFLGGASTLVALPALESLLPRHARAQAAAPPKRFLAWYFPCGVPAIDEWRPSAFGADWQPPALLSGVTTVKNRVSVLSGLRNEGRGPDHTYGTAAFLTCNAIENIQGPSVDQVIANGLMTNGTNAPFHSLQLSIRDSVCERQDICEYCNHISYGANGNVIQKQMDPVAAFDGLFAGFDPGASSSAAEERRTLQKSVLDSVYRDAESLKTVLSARDRLKLQEYMDSVRTVELELDAVGGTPACSQIEGVAFDEDADLDAEISAFSDVMALAFECDLTRVITFMAASGATGKSQQYPDRDYHLDITHHSDPDWLPKFRDVVTWEVQKFGQFVERLAGKTEADGVTPLIDNCALFFSSEISDGNRHNHDDMPVLLAGGLSGALTPGQHLMFDSDETFADVFMYIAGQMGVPLTEYGQDGQGRIVQL